MTTSLTTRTALSFDDAVSATRAALADEGFGVLTEIDVQATLKAKLDVDGPPYLILGACNPPLAHQALTVDPSIGLLLPCNVVVRQDPDDAGVTVVEAMDPQLMVSVTEQAALSAVADEARRRLLSAIAQIPA